MKKSKKILIVIGILIIALICIFIILNKGNSETGEIVLVQKVSGGHKKFDGTAVIICESGNIYHANLTKVESVNDMTETDINNYVLKHGEKAQYIMTQDEIEKIKSTKLNNELTDNSNGPIWLSEGSTTIKVYDSSNNEYVTLLQQSATMQINTAYNTNELIDIVNNIIGKIY